MQAVVNVLKSNCHSKRNTSLKIINLVSNRLKREKSLNHCLNIIGLFSKFMQDESCLLKA